MLEEWRGGDGIEVLDGWTFQVYLLFTDLNPDLIYCVFSFHRSQCAYFRKTTYIQYRLLLPDHTSILKMTRCMVSFPLNWA